MIYGKLIKNWEVRGPDGSYPPDYTYSVHTTSGEIIRLQPGDIIRIRRGWDSWSSWSDDTTVIMDDVADDVMCLIDERLNEYMATDHDICIVQRNNPKLLHGIR